MQEREHRQAEAADFATFFVIVFLKSYVVYQSIPSHEIKHIRRRISLTSAPVEPVSEVTDSKTSRS